MFITTYSGAKFYVDDCNIEDVPIKDIAHALSMNCRFNGHIEDFYSVAEHSVIVSELVPEEDALWGLMHDATEAFVPDIPRPFKHLITGFHEFEDKLAKKMAEKLGLSWPMPESVKYIDKNIVADEAARLFPEEPDWIKHYDSVIDPTNPIGALEPRDAYWAFIDRYEELTQ